MQTSALCALRRIDSIEELESDYMRKEEMMRSTIVAVLFRLLIGDSSDLEYEDGERYSSPEEATSASEEGDADADWMAFDPSICSALAQIAAARSI
jgi:hypothetical protein